MLDVDHFKDVNDQHGHAVGDLALKHLSALLLAHMREVDRLARFGGEEFLVLLPGLALNDALPVAERLRAVVVAAPMPLAGVTITLSVSIGMAEWAAQPTSRHPCWCAPMRRCTRPSATVAIGSRGTAPHRGSPDATHSIQRNHAKPTHPPQRRRERRGSQKKHCIPLR